MKLGIIPARGGSKRIPRKNIRNFCGRPMIAWSIDAARSSGCFDHIVVSTDDDEIAEVSVREGAEVPFRRPVSISDDFTPTTDVVIHAIEACEAHFALPAVQVCCIYATAPFINASDIAEGLRHLDRGSYRFVFPVATFPYPIQRALRRCGDGSVEMFAPENFAKRSQDLEEGWHDAGQFYWGTKASWNDGSPLFESANFGMPLARSRVQDIDTLEDWECAEQMFEAAKSFKGETK